MEPFERLVAELGETATLSSPRTFELVFAEESLSARATLAPDDRTLLTDIYVHDVSAFAEGVRRSLVRAVLSINDLAARDGDYAVSIDTRSFLVLTGRLPLAGLTGAGAFAEAVTPWLAQARRLRDLARAIAFEGGALSFETEAV